MQVVSDSIDLARILFETLLVEYLEVDARIASARRARTHDDAREFVVIAKRVAEDFEPLVDDRVEKTVHEWSVGKSEVAEFVKVVDRIEEALFYRLAGLYGKKRSVVVVQVVGHVGTEYVHCILVCVSNLLRCDCVLMLYTLAGGFL